jgi:hypothetical protein
MLALVVGAPCGRRRVFRSAGDRPGAGWRGYARRRAPGPGDRARGPGAARPGHPRRRPGGPWRSRTLTLTLTLTFSSVMSRSRIDCNATAANASLISNRSTSAGVLPSRPNALRIALAGWHSSDGSGPATTPCPPISHPGFAAVFATAGYHRPSTASGGGIGSGSPVNSPTSPPLIRYGRRPSSCLFRCEAAAVGGTPWGAGQASYSNAASGPCGPGARLHARPAFAQPEQSRRRCRTSSPCRTLKMFVPLTFSPGWFYRGPSS